MGSDQSTFSEGGLGRSKQDPSKFSTSRPIGEGSSLPPSRSQIFRTQAIHTKSSEHRTTPKHSIVVVADGSVTIKDPDPELTRLNTIPTFEPMIKSSLNLVSGSRDQESLEKLDHHSLLLMALRYQDHLKQLSEAVAFDQNALCVRIKEVTHIIQVVNNKLHEEDKKYLKTVEQFERVTEMVTTLNKVKTALDHIVPCMNHLNQLLPASEQLEPCAVNITAGNRSIQTS
ncbi:BLOC-1-related complex subunit 5-like isoform X1 [Babylonia areolata]|uniref:BLOC-1-related complex subunit 5-like isoform X1 n=1 Tax=Babylonia areolata TaxID=304850 RepID=UPI003FCF3973